MKKDIYWYDLFLYKKFLELEKQVNFSTHKMPCDYRRDFLTPFRQLCKDSIKLIEKAYKNPEMRIKCLEKIEENINDIELDVRHWFDMKFITKKGFSYIITIEGEIGKQINGWKKKH